MTNYQVGDFLTQIKNAALVKRHEVVTQATKFKLAVAKTLQKSGFVEDFSVKDKILSLRIKFSHKEPILLNIKLVSKPGQRIYLTAGDLREKKGPSIFLVSTPKGVITSKEAIKLGIGGEIIAEVW
jgi:small subunit ribosomal protein S8